MSYRNVANTNSWKIIFRAVPNILFHYMYTRSEHVVKNFIHIDRITQIYNVILAIPKAVVSLFKNSHVALASESLINN